MKHKFAGRYHSALRKHLNDSQPDSLESARGLGSQALSAGLHTLDLAKLHEQILITQVLPMLPANKRASLIKRRGVFFVRVITPIEKTDGGAGKATAQLKKHIETLRRRTVELAASNLELSLEFTLRKAAEEALKKSEHHYTLLLEQSDRLQEQLRRLSRKILPAQDALTNVGRPARASRADVGIEMLPDGVCMKIRDDGKSFAVDRVLNGNGSVRLGLLRIRERLEMIGGRFSVESRPGQGTTVTAFLKPAKDKAVCVRAWSTGAGKKSP
jgi:hypothetical protein